MYYLLSVGLGGGRELLKASKSIDIGMFPLGPVESPTCLVPTFSDGCVFPSNPLWWGVTLLDFRDGDKTTGPSCGATSEGLQFSESPFRWGRGSFSGIVGGGWEEKYLIEKMDRI